MAPAAVPPPARAQPVTSSGTVHTPATQVSPAPHDRPQIPQCAVLTRVSASHPLAATPSQSAKFALHMPTSQRAARHAGVPLAMEHAPRHAPQWATVTRVSTSHPLGGSPSQSAKPAAQVATQAPIAHAAVWLAAAAHARPHIPQWAPLDRVSTSQPLATSRSQSAKGAAQASTAQRPAAQRAVALARSQRAPQAPQWAAAACVSTHAEAQQVAPVAQGCDALHPATQALPEHTRPAGQCASVTHSTQACEVTSQRRPVGQPASPRHPATHAKVAASQC